MFVHHFTIRYVASRSYHHTVYTTMFCWQILHVKVLLKLRLLIQSYYIYNIIYIYITVISIVY